MDAGDADREPEQDAGIDAPEIGAAALDRLIFFSDAVFAIAMTLLVLAIPRPPSGVDIAKFLKEEDTGKFIAYFISFWVIALYWLAHHRLFRVVTRYDYGVLLLNLVLLFFIAFLPYPSAVLGDNGANKQATVFYAVCVAATGAASTALVWYVVMFRRFTIPLPRLIARYYVFRGLIVPLIFLASIPVARAGYPKQAQWLWLLTFVLPALGFRFVAKRQARPA
ncbi:MAG TPA: TMEM175 family protein [Actinomycetota bacterium]|nr:TMEM175 family protein [Actinomycetota bacterium]